MKFNVKQKDESQNYLVIDKLSGFDSLKKEVKSGKTNIFLDESVINLTQKLYGNSKSESMKIQKENCKKMVKLFKFLKKLVKFFARQGAQFDGTFFCENLADKKNNNDFMISAMLETYFCFKPLKRLGASIGFACEYLDKETRNYDMCDFQNDICVAYRENGSNKPFGCCPSKCLDKQKKICDKNCLACKIFMCDYLIYKGNCFNVHGIAVLKKNMSFFERKMCEGLLFTGKKSTLKFLWVLRGFEIFFFFALLAIIVAFIVSICLIFV